LLASTSNRVIPGWSRLNKCVVPDFQLAVPIILLTADG
jgi:hypothetical protein